MSVISVQHQLVQCQSCVLYVSDEVANYNIWLLEKYGFTIMVLNKLDFNQQCGNYGEYICGEVLAESTVFPYMYEMYHLLFFSTHALLFNREKLALDSLWCVCTYCNQTIRLRPFNSMALHPVSAMFSQIFLLE